MHCNAAGCKRRQGCYRSHMRTILMLVVLVAGCGNDEPYCDGVDIFAHCDPGFLAACDADFERIAWCNPEELQVAPWYDRPMCEHGDDGEPTCPRGTFLTCKPCPDDPSTLPACGPGRRLTTSACD